MDNSRGARQGWLNFPWAAISGRKAVTFSGKPAPVTDGVEQPGKFDRRDRAQPGVVEDLVAVTVADAGGDMRVGERPFQGVVFSGQARGEFFEGAVHDGKAIGGDGEIIRINVDGGLAAAVPVAIGEAEGDPLAGM